MCGRYQRRSDKQRIAEAFAVGNIDGLALELTPDYNVAPQTMQPVILWDEHEGTRTLQMMFWRFLPRFVTDPKKFKLSTINAKSETLLSNQIWRDSFLRRRCLVPVDTFIEWRKSGRRRLPYVFAMKDDSPFALGGVWHHWLAPRPQRWNGHLCHHHGRSERTGSRDDGARPDATDCGKARLASVA